MERKELMYIQAKDLRIEQRADLAAVVPLDTPYSLFIEPTNTCNFRCSYCPTGDTALLQKVGRKNKLMDWSLFVKIVDDLKQFPRKLRMVNMYKDGESLIHPRFTDMVRLLKDSNVVDRIWVKTNGHLLSPEYNERLVSCGLDMIGISVQHVHAQGFYDVAGVKIDYGTYKRNILDLYQRRNGVHLSIKIADVGLSENDKRRFYDDFSDRCDFITIEGLHGWSASDTKDWRLGTDQSFDGLRRTDKIACPLTLYMLAINSNGRISICNDDWMQAHNIGDVNTESLLDIWRGDRLKAFRVMHLEGRRHENAACKSCDYLRVLPDNIDAERLQILGKL
jgi:radical SAM protein with 4Fe4S-binding SPASM domain